MVPPCSARVSRAPTYFSNPQYLEINVPYGAITHYGEPFQTLPVFFSISNSGCSGFARRYFRNLGWFLFLQLLRCFSSPRSPPYAMYSRMDQAKAWSSLIRRPPDQSSLSAPRGFSQTAASFIACDRQGIHHMHLVAWSYNPAAFYPARFQSTCNVSLFSKCCFGFLEKLANLWMQSQPMFKTVLKYPHQVSQTFRTFIPS